jgi:hypothetical protein
MPSPSSIRRNPARRNTAISVFLFLALQFLTFAALPAHADTKEVKKVMMVVPNAMRRTALNMVAFRNRRTAIMQWLDIAATLADAETTRRSIGRGSTEYNPFLGRHPGGPRAYGMLLTMGFGYATITQVIQDRVEKPRPFTLGITAMAAFAHSYVAYHNTTICPGNMTCNTPPAN